MFNQIRQSTKIVSINNKLNKYLSSKNKNKVILTDKEKQFQWFDISVIKNKGKVFESEKNLTPVSNSDYFPDLLCTTLDGVEKKLPSSIQSKVKLVTFSFVSYSIYKLNYDVYNIAAFLPLYYQSMHLSI